MKTLLTLAALAAVPSLPAIAQAPARTEVVSFADLELDTPAGRATLARRIRHAADQVCGTASDFDLVGQNRLFRCRADAVAAAEQAMTRQATVRGTMVTVAVR